ncbi:hypothetical protein H0A70_05235 [Alcaligenaceae bacterium]|nr:hypothetical protein [Alcaligenaceae bacterium]
MENIKWRQLFERAYPYLWAAAAAYGMYRYGHLLNLTLTDSLVSTTTTVTSILMGFLGTSYGILLSATSKRIEWAKGRQPIWAGILQFFNESFVANFVLCIYSIALAMLATHPLIDRLQPAITVCWVFLIVLAVVSFFRAMRVLFGLLRTDA